MQSACEMLDNLAMQVLLAVGGWQFTVTVCQLQLEPAAIVLLCMLDRGRDATVCYSSLACAMHIA